MGELASVLDGYASVCVAELPDARLLDEIRELLAVRDRIDGLVAERLRMADLRDATITDRGLQEWRWLQAKCRLSARDAKARMEVARALAVRPLVAAALAEGAFGQDHAREIVSALKDLPEDEQDDAEAFLVQEACTRDVDEVRLLAKHCERVTQVGEKAEEAAQRKFASRWFSMDRTFDGMYAISGMLYAEGAATLLAALGPLAAPFGPEDERTKGQRMADALGELAGHALACGGLPDSGGERPQIMVTIDHETLCSQIRDAWAQLCLPGLGGPGELIRAEDARRIACDASIIPVLLGSAGEVLDIGRATRVFPAAIRRAARLRDGGCAFPGCNAGLDRCQLHHLDYWSRGGATSLANCCHLCTFHHWLIHTETWTLHRDPDGTIVATSADGRQYRAPPRARAG